MITRVYHQCTVGSGWQPVCPLEPTHPTVEAHEKSELATRIQEIGNYRVLFDRVYETHKTIGSQTAPTPTIVFGYK